MFVVNSYSLAVIFCFITMLCWGSWGNTQKLAGKTWRYELFYWDYVIGMVLFAILLGFTMGSIGTRGPSLPRRPRAGRMGRHRQRRAGRRDLQRLEHPALGLGIAGRTFGGLPAGRGTRAGAGRRRQLRRGAERRSFRALPGRCAHRCRNYLQRHCRGAHAQERRLGGPEPQRASCWPSWRAC